jgi:TRAP-type C4-dicarboxylate transport system permease small subunit
MFIRRLNRLVGAALEWTIGFIMAGIVIILFIGVILRYLFNAPLFWSEEVTVLGLIWMIFLSGAILVRQDKNVCITVICDLCKPHHSDRIRNLADLLVLFILVVMGYLSWQLKDRLAFSTTPALRISEDWFGWALVIGFLFMLYYQAQRVVAIFLKREPFPGEDLDREGECKP